MWQLYRLIFTKIVMVFSKGKDPRESFKVSQLWVFELQPKYRNTIKLNTKPIHYNYNPEYLIKLRFSGTYKSEAKLESY